MTSQKVGPASPSKVISDQASRDPEGSESAASKLTMQRPHPEAGSSDGVETKPVTTRNTTKAAPLSLARMLDELKDRYVALHAAKEDRFWEAKMGLGSDPAATQAAFNAAEIALKELIQDPKRLRELRAMQTSDKTDLDQQRLAGWITFLSAHTIESPRAQKLAAEIVELEGELQTKRRGMELGYTDPTTGAFVAASSNKLNLMVRTEHDEALRRAAYEGLKSIEKFVLANGFLDIVKKRNELGRMLGYDDYYDWRTSVVEGMRKTEIFALLDDLGRRTEERCRDELKKFAAQHGAGALAPWNFSFLRSGSLTRELDPYFRFSQALRIWGETFQRLGIRYRGATLTLDLVDRRGKYDNGFMHGPGPAFNDGAVWRPARINFSANAVPGAVGAGMTALKTTLHEGGHGAHFSNITMDAPCYSQEFAPTSVAYAETQSMFLDSLLGDPDWRLRYAHDKNGAPPPVQLLERAIRETQPLRGWDMRAMLTVPMAERAIYEMSDGELTPERVLEKIGDIERRMQGLTGGVRPVLAVPHLLSGESSAYYHGYVLAEMGVQQTRAFFKERDGYIVDNPRVGPDLARAYWAKGNSVGFSDTLKALTGKPLSADALVARCNRSVDEELIDARAAMARVAGPPPKAEPIDLQAHVKVMHGPTLIGDSARDGFDGMCDRFADWIEANEASASA